MFQMKILSAEVVLMLFTNKYFTKFQQLTAFKTIFIKKGINLDTYKNIVIWYNTP